MSDNQIKGEMVMEINRVNNTVDISRHTDISANRGQNYKLEQEKEKLNTGDKTKYMEDREKYTEDEIISTIEKANEEFVAYDRRFEFSIHEQTKKIMVKIIDVANDEVIREIPPEKILDLVAAIWDMAGILVDERV